MGFTEVKRAGGVGDCGEDVVAYQPANWPGVKPVSRRWVFQCKRTKQVSKSDIRLLQNNELGRVG
jgi:hypothetical protein